MILTYTYECDVDKGGCSKILTFNQERATYKPKKRCPHCQSKKHTLIRRLDLDLGSAQVKLADSEITKLGHLAARNNEKFSDDYKQHLIKKNNSYKENTLEPKLPSGMTHIKRPEKTQWT